MEIFIITIIFLVAGGLYFYFKPQKNDYHEIVLLLSQGKYKDVISRLEPLYPENKTDPYLNYYLGKAYIKEGNIEKAIRSFESIRDAKTFNSEVDEFEVRKSLALLYYREQKFAEALLEFKEYYDINPVDAEVNAHLGFMIIGQEEFELAEEYLKNAAGFQQDNLSYRIAYGVCLYQNGKKEEALKEFEKAEKIDSESELVNLLIAYVSFQLGNWKETEKTLIRALSKIQEEYLRYVIKRFQGLVYYKLDNYSLCIKSYREAAELCEKNKWQEEKKEIFYYLAFFYLLEENFEESQNCILEIEIDDPDYKNLQNLATFRSSFEDGLVSLDKETKSGFNFYEEIKEFEKDYFPEQFLFKLSGLKAKYSLNVKAVLGDQEQKKNKTVNISANNNEELLELLEKYNNLSPNDFIELCRKFISQLDYVVQKESQGENKEGLDFIAENTLTKEKAYFQFRQWKGQNISDIYLRNLAAKINELKAHKGFLVGDINLTPGALTALDTLSKINIYNDMHLAEILKRILI